LEKEVLTNLLDSLKVEVCDALADLLFEDEWLWEERYVDGWLVSITIRLSKVVCDRSFVVSKTINPREIRYWKLPDEFMLFLVQELLDSLAESIREYEACWGRGKIK